MARFKTKDGREWVLEVTLQTYLDFRQRFEIDLRTSLKENPKPLAEALGDPDRLGQILWMMCEDQALKLKLEPEQFARLFNGDAARSALTALWEAIWDFGHGPEVAEKAGNYFRAGLKERAKATVEFLDRLPAMIATSPTPGSSGSNAAAGSASTPDPSASATSI